jgi:hypothetical protein
MDLKQNILNDLNEAMKSGDTLKRDTLRFLLSAVKNVEIEKKKKETGLTDEEILEVIARSIKQRKDSVEQYTAGGRLDLAAKEQKEINILMSYMPEQLGEEAIRKIVKETIVEVTAVSKADIGKVMSSVMKKLKGKADGSAVKKIVEDSIS